ncbi:MAG: hypothetical protein PHQ60_02320 [Sideroxydans sp.]|nr:hypothetical protein [Sideroxydans sp.]MDD5056679.1 hypothetical protein [Sideroxydans sp.]
MNNLVKQLRLALAEKCLGWAMIIAPLDTSERKDITEFVSGYFQKHLAIKK